MLKSFLLWSFRRNYSLKGPLKPSRMAAVGEGGWGQWSEFNLCDPKSCPPALACAAQPVPSTTWAWSSTLGALWIPFFTPDSSFILYIKYNIIKVPFRTPFVKLESQIPVVLMEQLLPAGGFHRRAALLQVCNGELRSFPSLNSLCFTWIVWATRNIIPLF